MKYFTNINSLDELKKAYRRLAMKHHPDCGGSDEIMKQINAEHDALFETLKASHNKTADEYHQTTETAEEFRDIITALLKLDGLEIELCGSWLWVTGNTKEHKDNLKELGFKYSANKQAWYYHEGEYHKRGKSKKSMQDIRNMYGSESFATRTGEPEQITA